MSTVECLEAVHRVHSSTGRPGMCSLHANSARAAVTKLCTLSLLAGECAGEFKTRIEMVQYPF
jgi:hypothetical protein